MKGIALATLAFAATTTPVLAAEHTLNACRHADGTPAPITGWQPVVNDTAQGNQAQDSCGQGGHIDLALGAGSHSPQASVLLTNTLPPGTTWTKLQAWVAYRSNPMTAQDDHGSMVAMTVAGMSPCGWGKGPGCSRFGVFEAAPLAEVNKVTVTNTGQQPLQVGVVCDSTPNPCPATSGDPYAIMRVWRLAVTVNEPDPPTIPATHDTGQPAPGVVRVHNGSGRASYGYLTARLRRDRKGRLHLSGRLVDMRRRPITNALLVVKRSPGKATKAMTGKTGRYHRVLGLGRRVVVRWYPWNDSTKHISTKGKTR